MNESTGGGLLSVNIRCSIPSKRDMDQAFCCCFFQNVIVE